MADEPQGCARVTGALVPEKGNHLQSTEITDNRKEKPMTPHVGQKAPDFTAPAYYQWILLCFYPGDFTFV